VPLSTPLGTVPLPKLLALRLVSPAPLPENDAAVTVPLAVRLPFGTVTLFEESISSASPLTLGGFCE
jgi:hypothetical protein